MHSSIRSAVPLALTVATALTVGACGSSSSKNAAATGSSSSSSAAAAPSASYPASSQTKGAKVDLAGVCPSTVTVQTDWNPEADHGSTYEMLGPHPSIDTSQKSVTSDLYANGQPTGVKLKILVGGPAIGYAAPNQEMYEDKSITFGYVTTDSAIEFSAKFPTTAVFAENNISPTILMWSPAQYPKVTTIKQLGAALQKSNNVVYYESGSAYMQYLTSAGYLPASVINAGYTGTPGQFVVAQGKDAQQGFVTAEPYIYEHEVQAWDKPVRYQLVSATGYDPYPEAMSVRTGQLKQLTPCLKKLVPVLQQADVDYLDDPMSTNVLIDQLVTDYDNGWTYDIHVGTYGAAMMKQLEDQQQIPYIGYMSSSRIATLIKQVTPIFDTTKGSGEKSGVTPGDLYTDQFMDPAIKVGSSS